MVDQKRKMGCCSLLIQNGATIRTIGLKKCRFCVLKNVALNL